MKTLITGSLAFDTIMVFEDQFKNHILPDQTHILNVVFMTPQMQRFQGGCAGNIAYNLQMLGGEPLIMATVGQDFGPYAEWMSERGFDLTHVTEVEGQFTAQAFITTDTDNNQITAFHPGAMAFAHHNKVGDADGVELGIVAPNGFDGMVEHAAQFAAAGIPFVFDPGQGLPMFNGEQLLTFMEQATYTIVNDYESQQLMDKTGLPLAELAALVDTLIVTKGGKGSEIYTGAQQFVIPSAPITRATDPTGCGDAYRAGILFGLANDLGWEDCGRIASLCGAIKIEQAGTQGHSFTLPDFAKRYRSAFGSSFPVAV